MREGQPTPNTGEQLPPLPVGLSAVAFPEIGVKNEYGQLALVPPEQALAQLNEFLGQLNEQGADIVTTLDVEVDTTDPNSMSLPGSKPRKFAVVRRIEGTPGSADSTTTS
jgi:hypothetical protein